MTALRAGLFCAMITAALGAQAPPAGAGGNAADTVLLGGKVLTVDPKGTIAQALAVRGGRVIAAGTDAQVRKLAGPNTAVIELRGKTVIPGLIESHIHAVSVAREEAYQPWVQLETIAEVQAWIRRRAASLPPGQWIKVPRTDITRLKERRHPTPAELDAGSTAHPVVFNAARKNVLNTAGFRALGIGKDGSLFAGAKIIRDASGNALMIAGGDTRIQEAAGQPRLTPAQTLDGLEKVLRRYNEVGITGVFERAADMEIYHAYQQMRAAGRLTTRVTLAYNLGSAHLEQAERQVRESGLHHGEGDDWVKIGPLKLFADGGIHWGNTFLRVPYGEKRIAFYRLDNPEYRGDFHYTDDELKAVIRMAHRLGWPVTVHVTGDGGVDRVLDAMEAANADRPIAGRRFTLTHAYFPTPEAVARARRLGVCVDTQPYLYYRDSPAMDEVYGRAWAERLIGLGDWIHGGVATAISSDHMIGMDPNHAMNSFNPFLQAYIAVTRRNERGEVIGERQKISRMEALRAMTRDAAYLSFMERGSGSLETGKYADLAVLDRDYLTCPDPEVKDIRVVMTMAGGKVVYERR